MHSPTLCVLFELEAMQLHSGPIYSWWSTCPTQLQRM